MSSQQTEASPSDHHPAEVLNTQYAAGPVARLRATLCRLTDRPYFGLAAIVLLSTALNIYITFFSSDYHNYLTSDMHGYWERALQVFRGDEMNPNTWVSNAPFYPRVTSAIFTWVSYFHLDDYFLEFMLAINILMSAIGNIALYFIGLKLFRGSKGFTLFLTGMYAFAYPNLYFNTFLLGEPFAVPLIITALAMVMYLKSSPKIFWAGLLMGFAVGVRPSNGPIGLPCALYILFSGLSFAGFLTRDWIRSNLPRVLYAGLFSLGFFLVIFGVVAENNRISHGQLRGITAHSGYNFFLGQTQAHLIEAHYDGIGYGFVPSSVANHPEYGSIRVTIPIYDSKTYFEEGFKVLEQHPELWLEHFGKLENLFFNNLFPSVPAVWGFNPLIDVYRYVAFYMLILGVGFVFVGIREKSVKVADFALFASIFALSSASLLMFTITHQYFTNFSYTVYAMFSLALFGVVRHFKEYKKVVLRGLAGLVIVVAGYYLVQLNYHLFIDEKIKVTLVNNDGRVYSFKQEVKPESEEVISVDELNFTQALNLTHAKLGQVGEHEYLENFFLTAETDMEVINDGRYMLHIYADDGFRVTIDDKVVFAYDGLKKMSEKPNRKFVRLKKGKHKLKVELLQAGVFSGLVGYIRRVDNHKRYAPYEYDTKKGKGPYIGQDSDDIKYSFPEE